MLGTFHQPKSNLHKKVTSTATCDKSCISVRGWILFPKSDRYSDILLLYFILLPLVWHKEWIMHLNTLICSK